MSTPEAIDLEYYEQQSKQRLARHFEEEDRMDEHLRRQRARMIAESDARLLEMRRQMEQERARYEEEERRRELEIQRLRRAARAADRNAYESQNAAREATAESDRAEAQILGFATRVAPPIPSYAATSRQSQHASPSRQANLRQATNREGEYPGYHRMEDLGVDSYSPPQNGPYPEHGDELSSIAGSLAGSSRIQVATKPPLTETNRGVPRER